MWDLPNYLLVATSLRDADEGMSLQSFSQRGHHIPIIPSWIEDSTRGQARNMVQPKYRLMLVLIPFTLAVALSLIVLSPSVEVQLMSVMKLVTSMYNFRFISLMIPGWLYSIQLWTSIVAYFHPPSLWQVSRYFHSSVECTSCAKHDFRNSPSVYLGFAVRHLKCDSWNCRLMKSHGFLVSISSDKVHHTFMILSFRM